MENIPGTKNKLFGWLFVAYPFLKLLIPTFIFLLLYEFGGRFTLIGAPLRPVLFLKNMGIGSTMIYALTYSLRIVGYILPLIILVSGVLLLKQKAVGVKLALFAFSANIVLKVFLAAESLLDAPRFGRILMPNIMIDSFFYIFFLIDLIAVYYLTRHKNEIA